MTLVMGIFLLRGEIIFGQSLFSVLKEVLMPGYLLLCGIMVGYLISVIWQGKAAQGRELSFQEASLRSSFLIGIGVGLLLALGYVFF